MCKLSASWCLESFFTRRLTRKKHSLAQPSMFPTTRWLQLMYNSSIHAVKWQSQPINSIICQAFKLWRGNCSCLHISEDMSERTHCKRSDTDSGSNSQNVQARCPSTSLRALLANPCSTEPCIGPAHLQLSPRSKNRFNYFLLPSNICGNQLAFSNRILCLHLL